MATEDHGGRGGKGPRERRVADGVAGGAHALACRGLRPLAEATRRSAILSPWDAVHLVECVAQPAAADWAHTRHRLQPGECRGLMVLGGLEAGERQGPQERSLIRAKGQGARDGLWDRLSGAAVGDAFTRGLVGALIVECG